MNKIYQVYQVSDSTGETLDRIFLALKAQFLNFEYNNHQFSFTRTQNQILKIIEVAKKQKEPIILYTIVDDNLAKFLEEKTLLSQADKFRLGLRGKDKLRTDLQLLG